FLVKLIASMDAEAVKRASQVDREKAARRSASRLSMFHPKHADDVTVRDHFTVSVADPKMEAAVRKELQQMGGPANARGAFLQGRLREFAGDLDGALQSYLQAADLLDRDRRRV